MPRTRSRITMCSPPPNASSPTWRRWSAVWWPRSRRRPSSVTPRTSTATALLVAALLVSWPATSRADERSAPQAMADRLLSAPLPGREPLDLAVRLRGVSASTPLTAPVPPPGLVAGYTDTFWVLDQRTARLFQAPATLHL